MSDRRTLEQVAATEHTTPLRLLRFCRRHGITVSRTGDSAEQVLLPDALARLHLVLTSPVADRKKAAREMARKRDALKTYRDQDKIREAQKTQTIEHADIVANAKRWNDYGCGIYFLIRRKVVVYVGQSRDILPRVGGHRKTKQFDSWHWIPCPPSKLNEMERAYLDALKPELNRDHTTLRLRSSVALESNDV